MSERAAGSVALVGAGPWDAGLLTLRGRALLERADAVVHDYLVNPDLLAHCPPTCEIVPTGEKPRRLSQAQISAELVRRARAGQRVVRLKGGDPFVFGRGGEEAEALAAAGVTFEVVPGVTAAIASAAYAGIPVTHRGYGPSLAFVTGHPRAEGAEPPLDHRALAGMATVVLLMGASRLKELCAGLMTAGRAPATPVALIRWATRPDQRTVVTTLADAAEVARVDEMTAPLTVIIGEVVGLRARIAWFERRPLYGRRIVVTRAASQQAALNDRLAELGAEVVALPTIAFEPGDVDALARAVRALPSYDLVIFTSVNGVDAFLDAVYAAGRDPRAFGAARLACIGPATARRLRDRGLVADLVPDDFVAEGLLAALPPSEVAGRRILLPRAEVARELLPDTLRAAGAVVDVVPAYRTVAPPVDPTVRARVLAGEVDLIAFTASSTVTHFAALFTDAERAAIKARVPAACIGPITARTATEAGFRVAVEAAPFTIPGLVDALVGWAAT